jgi:hypothetical protein
MNAKYDRDPEALAWARGHVERVIGKYRRFETDARNRGDAEKATQWRKFANLLRMELVGGQGCVITAFDERVAQLPAGMGDGA